MALFLNDQEVAQLLPMNECIDVLDRAFAHAGEGKVDNIPRNRIRMPGGFFHFMAAADAGHGVFGYKAYPSFAGPGSAKMIVMLYDYETGGLLSCMEAGRLGQIRTGAASGVATKYMAREDAATVAVMGPVSRPVLSWRRCARSAASNGCGCSAAGRSAARSSPGAAVNP